jgi:uncharacterized protein (DUF1501 family)
MDLSRRQMLLGGACSVAAHPALTTASFAALPSDNRLVVIILRGAMDGLDLLRPVEDPLYAQLRPTLAGDGLDLGGPFALHPALEPLMPMWRRGDLAFAQAVSTPYRDKRSHFDGQDLLEAGIGMDGVARGGWLNRLVSTLPGAGEQTAFGVGGDLLPILSGEAQVSRWSPQVDVDLSPQAELLLRRIYAPDPAFAAAGSQALTLSAVIESTDLPKLANGNSQHPLAAFAAERLLGETRVAAFSLPGWDTHQGQASGISRAMGRLAQMLMTLEEALGAGVWGKTMVLAMTEFGRTVAENGSKGTDHGTAGAMVLAGGALRGGRIFGDWPGLDEAALYQRRDLMPTDDVRRYAAWAMRHAYGIERGVLERTIFPGLDLGDPLQLVL